ncbi:hypothetical protein CCM_02851 [Cordyceps militaris CM01]|uniref:Uncharacterized protein n=1 Tax=Cordyceps militaris (strain CM01) TaxID=983644 RepID=G3JC65_CORMM|nr:uncharacterized protein CCM_02851 [Cordyceps militaris CM01]EGX94580.1 hypothetical protein CCM_02851 [Cordyceps militaris CM01]
MYAAACWVRGEEQSVSVSIRVLDLFASNKAHGWCGLVIGGQVPISWSRGTDVDRLLADVELAVPIESELVAVADQRSRARPLHASFAQPTRRFLMNRHRSKAGGLGSE